MDAATGGVHEGTLFGWVQPDARTFDRPQDTSDAILIRTDGVMPHLVRRYQIGTLEVGVVVGGKADVEPLPTARRWLGVVLGYVIAGELSITQEGRTATLGVGDFAFYSGARSYRITAAGHHEYLVVRIPTSTIAVRHGHFAEVIAAELAETSSAQVLRGILATLARPDGEPSLSASAHVADALVAASHAVIAEARDPGTATALSLFNSLAMWLEARLSSSSLCAEELARAHYLSPRYVRKVFAANGATVSGFIRQRRLEHIRNELLDPMDARTPIGVIASRWGMIDPASFSRAYTRQYGVPPRRYRALHLHQGQPEEVDWDPDDRSETLSIPDGGVRA